MIEKQFTVIFHGDDDPLTFYDGEVYEAVGIDELTGWFYVIDETGESYMYPPSMFEVVS